MTTTARNSLSAAALGLASFTLSSAFFSGLFATVTVTGFALLAAYGLLEITLLSYAAPRPHVSRPAPSAPIPAGIRVRRVPALVEYPALGHSPACRALAA